MGNNNIDDLKNLTPDQISKKFNEAEVEENEDNLVYEKVYLDVYYYFKIDLLTNALTPAIKSIFNKKNAKGKRLSELTEWKNNYLNKKTLKVPKELKALAKELKLL